MNSYPYLDNKLHPTSDIALSELVPRVRKNRIIDISNSPLVPAMELRKKLDVLLRAGELDGGLPILRKNILVGLIPAPELEFALDRLENEAESMCLMCTDSPYGDWSCDGEAGGDGNRDRSRSGLNSTGLMADFTPYIDPVGSFHHPSPQTSHLQARTSITFYIIHILSPPAPTTICTICRWQIHGVMYTNLYICYSYLGTHGIGYPLPHRPCIPMLRKAWAALHVCPTRWPICWPGAQEVLCQIHEGA